MSLQTKGKTLQLRVQSNALSFFFFKTADMFIFYQGCQFNLQFRFIIITPINTVKMLCN